MATVLPQLDIDVTGESSLMLPPERAVLSVEVCSRTTNDDEKCTTQAITDARAVKKVLRASSANDSIDYWSRTSLTENDYTPRWTEKNPDPPTEFTSRVSFDCHVQKFSRLGPLIHDLTSIPRVPSRGIEWVLTPSTQNAHRSALRAEAAKNAREKAQDYAVALG